MQIREIGVLPNKKREEDIFSKIFFEAAPINSAIFYFEWAVEGGANAVFGPMAMILCNHGHIF
jgi:hypothetical protein